MVVDWPKIAGVDVVATDWPNRDVPVLFTAAWPNIDAGNAVVVVAVV